MNALFREKFQQLLIHLTSDLRYWSPANGQMIAPQVVETLPPPPDSATDVDSEYPMVCWAIYKGELSPSPQPVKLVVDFGIKVDESDGATIEQIRRGAAAMQEITNSLKDLINNRRVGGYRLQLPLDFTIGDQSHGFEGMQPHPYYHGRIYLSFLPM